MRKFIHIFIVFLLAVSVGMAQSYNISPNRYVIEGNPPDTLYLIDLHEVVVTPKKRTKRQVEIYWRLVRDVKRTLPYAKLVAKRLDETNKKLATLPNDAARKKYMKVFEKQLFAQYEKELRKMTYSQGKLLIRLIDRECTQTSYDLIKMYRGGFSAFFWQGVATVFGANLKSEYDENDKDLLVEHVINLVELGLL